MEPYVNQKKLGKQMLAFYLPYRTSVLNALIDAENSKGGPVYFAEVMKAWQKKDSYLPTIEALTL